jgi:hypothetical protein
MKVADADATPTKKAGKGVQTWTYPNPEEHAALGAYAAREKRTIGNAIIHLAMKQLQQEQEAAS